MKIFTTAFLLLFSVICFGQETWEKTDNSTSSEIITTRLPNSYQLYNIDISEIKRTLKDAPDRSTRSLDDAGTIMTFPNQEGQLQQFKILEAPMMEPELAAQFPMIKTYVGQGIEDPTALLNLSIGTDGLHAMIRSVGKSPLFIDPYTKDRSKYIIYSKSDLPREGGFPCGFQNESPAGSPAPMIDVTRNITDGMMRSYNVAIATTVEYSQFHLTNQSIASGATTAVKKAAVLSAITTTINRVKGIYETELSVTFVLNANISSIIFIDSDNFSNSNANALIDESQTVIDNIIGNANYDIGHTFSTGGGGLASLGGICTVTNKARAITGGSSPIGDSYDVDFVAHEMGHHFGANHTYNGTGAGSCTTSTSSTAAEPGGGTTIMAYAGICGALDVQSNSDAYFHILSLKEINNRLTNTGGFTHSSYLQCSDNTSTGNQEPTANAGSDYTIPNGTAFVLTGSANDPDGDAMTYCWDQLDLAQPNVYPLVSTTATGPLYRSFTPSSNPSRFMPAFATVFNGAVQNTWEVTPTVARSLNFNLTARDNKTVGGQSTSDDMLVTVAAVGPFKVTSQSAAETWTTGQSITISWDVAGTTANGINTANVEITLVNSSGTVLNTLAASTPNDGSHSITVPSTVNNNARIKVTAIGNIFYAVNSAAISLNTTPAYCNTVCASSGGTQYADGTTLVNFGTINNSSTGASAYTDYTSISTDLTVGQSYNLTVNVNTDGNYVEATRVWIDWNRNCDFTDAGEEYDLGTAVNVTNGPTSSSGLSITVPAGASLGDTRMRVTSAYNAYKTSCQNSFAGEVEDYSLNIVAVLPVELTYFKVKAIDNRAIQLDWNTASEINNEGFEIEHSDNGSNWKMIDFVKGNGTSLEQQSYIYTHEQPVSGLNYYRLKQIDYDGNFEYSKVASADISKEKNSFRLSPNPTYGSGTVTLIFEESNAKTITIYNALGAKVYQITVGEEQSNLEIRLPNLSSGIYTTEVVSGRSRATRRIVIK